jgi:uncharacterized protein YukE
LNAAPPAATIEVHRSPHHLEPPPGRPGVQKGLLMAQAIVDPAELRRFAASLKQFNLELRDRLASLHGQLVGLSDSWRDQEHERFTQEFEATMHALAGFLESADQHIPFLLRKAERIEQYLQQR